MVEQRMGIIGLGVMGRNLALNLADKGFGVTAFDPWEQACDQFATLLESQPSEHISLQRTLTGMVGALNAPRTILIMVKAGEPVDALIDKLKPLLSAGDVILDGGNSHYPDTIRRDADLTRAGLHFIGLGVSGGEEGARNGPSLMAGGNEAAYRLAGPMLEAMAAKHDGSPCCARLGDDGAGHYIKMVHNGIEYGLMQILAEAYHLMRDVLNISHAGMADLFGQWNEAELASYLVEITGQIFNVDDPLAPGPLVEIILDKAGQKGTGRWSSEAALAFGSPAMSIAEAVFARAMASAKDERLAAAPLLAGPEQPLQDVDRDKALEHLRLAVLGGFITTFAQGFALIEAGAAEQGWTIDMAQVCRVWRNGCVIRAGMLDDMAQAFSSQPVPQNLVCAQEFARTLKRCQTGWRETAVLAVRSGVPIPALGSALAWYDSYRSARLPANLIQAQRDYFGAHSYERTDREGSFHTEWATLAESGI